MPTTVSASPKQSSSSLIDQKPVVVSDDKDRSAMGLFTSEKPLWYPCKYNKKRKCTNWVGTKRTACSICAAALVKEKEAEDSQKKSKE